MLICVCMFLVKFTAGHLPLYLAGCLLFIVCSNYQWDICLTSRLVLPSQQLPFNPNVVHNVLKGEVVVVLINGKSRLLQGNAMD